MLRSSRQLLRFAPRSAASFPPAASSASFSTTNSPRVFQGSKRPSLALQARVGPLALQARYTNSPYDKVDKKAEAEIAKKKIEPRPEEVTTQSSTRQLFEPAPANPDRDADLQGGLRKDVNTVKETFNLSEVPREPYALGLAGTLPYLGTSLSTMYLSWDINLEWPSTSTVLNNIYMNPDSAQYWLNLLEPIQLGYGAIIISFLGAVHWGMEYAEKTPSRDRTRFRYGMGVLAPMIAWPTLLMPIEAALTSQFAAFTFLYLADSRAKNRGWTPQWYGVYRFVLTAIVGFSIFISLVGRSKIGNASPHVGQELAETMHKAKGDTSRDWAKLENEEKERIKKEKEEEEKKKKQEEKKSKQEDKKKPESKSKDKKEEKDTDEKGDSKKDESEGQKDEGEKKNKKDGSEKKDGEKDGGEKKDEEKGAESKDKDESKKDADSKDKDEKKDDKKEKKEKKE